MPNAENTHTHTHNEAALYKYSTLGVSLFSGETFGSCGPLFFGFHFLSYHCEVKCGEVRIRPDGARV